MASGALGIRLLGPVEVWRDDQPLPFGGAKQRTMLAVLALTPGKVVDIGTIARAVWGDDGPDKVAGTLQVYASNLRRSLGSPDGTPVIVWQAPGYRLAVEPDAVDLIRFRRGVDAARVHRAHGDVRRAAQGAREALETWNGEALGGLSGEGTITSVATALAAERREAVQLWIDAELDAGGSAGMVAHLERLVADHPLDEWFAARLMTALYRSGRQAEALGVFRAARERLSDELGIDPGSELRAVEAAILAQATSLLDLPGDAEGHDHTVTVAWQGGITSGAALVSVRGERYPLPTGGSATVGRSDACVVTVPHPSVSRRHAQLDWRDERHEVTDLGSTNGTMVNGRPLAAQAGHPLADGDRVTFGSTTLTYVAPPAG